MYIQKRAKMDREKEKKKMIIMVGRSKKTTMKIASSFRGGCTGGRIKGSHCEKVPS